METKRERELAAFERLLDVMDTVREKCPWDHKQTLETLRPQTIEETYELSDAILKKDMFNISKELGDLLLHVVFYAKIGKEQGEFDIADVCNKLCDKLIYRHPHIYGNVQVKNAEEVIGNWEQLKTKEKDGNKSVLSGVPESLPSVIKAYRIQEKARAVGFDWEKKEDVWNKVAEEFTEFKEALGKGGKEAQEELGDFLFSVINAARLYDIDPDTALEDTCSKFRRRFGYLEENTIKQGKSLKDMTLAEMDEYWDKAKELERKGEI
ncbi:MAG: nucleoside triphosphate pyrophosphohydrolase [Bacteroidales bacterium]|nr:nucleoside triphosphate pyrophosphohydrolase [Bacteroidales bacterium]